MSVTRIAAIIVRQYYLIRTSISRVVSLFIWVAVDIVLWGFISKYLNELVSTDFNFVTAFLGAVLLWDFFIRVMQGVATAFFEDVWTRNFMNLFTTPLEITEYICGLFISSILTSSVGLLVMLVMASRFFGLEYLSLGFVCMVSLFILFLFGIALGIVGCAIVLRFGPAAECYIWSVPALIAPFAGVFYSLSTLPLWMQYVAYALPPAYVFESVRAIISGSGSFSWFSFVIGGCLAGIYVLVACWLFIQTYKHAVRSGLIARYSAESSG
jgi:ABC-2 type transport system permease protein